MFDHLLSAESKVFREEVRDLVKWVPRQMILDMDQDRIQFPKAFLKEAGRRNLMGCRYPKQWGGRDMDWVTTAMAMETVPMRSSTP
jgi:alkylation response protein AidB-like acyl-CoA dehydrogenase